MIQYRRDLWKLLEEFNLVGPTAEIGVAEGFFSHDILNWPIRDRIPMHYLVDRWKAVLGIRGDSSQPQEWHDKNLLAAQERTLKFGSRACFLRGDSERMANFVLDRSLSLLYIDGDHSYIGVCRDLSSWAPKVQIGGIIAFHDYEQSAYGVKMAVTDFASMHKLTINLIPEDKPDDAGAWIRLC